MQIDRHREPADLLPRIQRLFDISAGKILSIEDTWKPEDGAPVFTVARATTRRAAGRSGRRASSSAPRILQFDATGDESFLDLGRARTLERMAPHLTHMGVHDHGFNNVSTYGNLWRLAREGRIDAADWEMRFYELALKVSGAVQARRWTAPPGRRLHPLVQRRALAVRRHDPFAARAGARARARAAADGGTGRRRSACSIACSITRDATAQYNVYFGRGRDAL